jgi:hypothetical protein
MLLCCLPANVLFSRLWALSHNALGSHQVLPLRFRFCALPLCATDGHNEFEPRTAFLPMTLPGSGPSAQSHFLTRIPGREENCRPGSEDNIVPNLSVFLRKAPPTYNYYNSCPSLTSETLFRISSMYLFAKTWK